MQFGIISLDALWCRGGWVINRSRVQPLSSAVCCVSSTCWELLVATTLLKLSVLGEGCSAIEPGGACGYWLITPGGVWRPKGSEVTPGFHPVSHRWTIPTVTVWDVVVRELVYCETGQHSRWTSLLPTYCLSICFCPPEISLWVRGGGDSQPGNVCCTRTGSYWERGAGFCVGLGMWQENGV